MALPGDIHKLSGEHSFVCEEHPDVPATYRLVGETDSFGSEYIYMCDECREEYINNPPPPIEDRCDWCNTYKPLKPFRDIEEGHCGRVYYVCQHCIDIHNQKMQDF